MSIFEILSDLASDNSRNAKIAKLTAQKDNVLLKKVIFLALDPFTQFYIRKIPAYTPAQANQADSLDSVLDSLSMLSTRQVTGNAAIDHLTKLLSSLVEDDAEVIKRIIAKDLKCGVNVATVNTVWKDFIHEYPCMLCSKYDEKIVSKIKFPAYVQLKMDGMRFNAIVKDGKCEFRSRNGKEINLLGNLEYEFIKLANGQNLVFDGELLVMEDGKIANRQTGNGILNKANKGTISEAEAKLVHATVWDLIPYNDFIKGKSNTFYMTRFALLSDMSLPNKIHLVESQLVSNLDKARELFNAYLAQGQEGIILKDLDGIWESKRVKSQVKFKSELDCDLKIVGVEEGEGKYAGMLGAIICESADGKLRVSVGSGFTDYQRSTLTDLIGKVAAVKYNAKITNKQGENSLFLPIVLEIRFDKTEADNFEDIA